MALMTSSTSTSEDPKAGAPASEIQDKASDTTMAMDLDVNGSKQDEISSQVPTTLNSSSSSNEAQIDATAGAAPPTAVNGNGSPDKDVRAPLSPPVPTPPLNTGSVDGQQLHDFHITSPAANVPGAASDFKHSPHPNEEAISPGTKMETDDHDSDMKVDSAKDAPAPTKTRTRDDIESDNEGDGRPTKRAKTDEIDTPAAGKTGPMPIVQKKFALQTLRSVKRISNAGPFLHPVDIVKLNIPTYPQFVKEPMDLSTMEKKLINDEYANVDAFQKDFKLIISNCVKFNGPEHKVTDMARTVEAAFNRHMEKMPAPDQPEVPDKKSHKKGASKSSNKTAARKVTPKAEAASPPAAPSSKASVTPVPAAPSASKSAKSKPAAKAKKETKQSQSQTFALDPGTGMPLIRRDSVASGDGRPKREIHPPPSRDLPYSDVKPRRKKAVVELKFCDMVVKELVKKPHEAYAYPFYAPVDPVALNIPDYFKIIKKPMDLGTIQSKLKTNQYDSAADFEADIRLMLTNCYKFNPPSSPVHGMGKKLEEVFNRKWAEKASYIQQQGGGSRSPQSPTPTLDEDEEMQDGTQPAELAMLRKQLESMQQQLEKFQNQAASGPNGQAGSASRKGKPGRKPSVSAGSTAGRRRPRKEEPVPELTMQEKTELSQRINLLPMNKLMYATKLIQENMPNLAGDEEIELDIDELPPDILYKLHTYVSKHAPPLSSENAYVEPTPALVSPPPAPAKAISKPKKNKPMSAQEQDAKINALSNKIANFANSGATAQKTPVGASAMSPVGNNNNYNNNHHNDGNDSSSDDDDDLSNSESEEE